MERLRDAIAKARARREAGKPGGAGRSFTPRPTQSPEPARAGDTAWDALEEVELDDDWLASQRIISWRKTDPAHVAFDVLRTRLMRLLQEKGWRRVLVTSPSKGCGKTTVTVNLAVSLARQASVRTLLIDADFKTPRVAACLGLARVPLPLGAWLRSGEPVGEHFIRIGKNLAVCLNTRATRNSAELLADPLTTTRLAGAIDQLAPDITIHDLPPMLVSDDVIAFLPQVDCALLIAAAGQTTAEEIEECERLLEGNTNFLGVLLNKCDVASASAYRYYDYASEPADEPA